MKDERDKKAHRKEDGKKNTRPSQHENFLDLINYINEYKQNISYESSDLLNVNPGRRSKEPDILEIKA